MRSEFFFHDDIFRTRCLPSILLRGLRSGRWRTWTPAASACIRALYPAFPCPHLIYNTSRHSQAERQTFHTTVGMTMTFLLTTWRCWDVAFRGRYGCWTTERMFALLRNAMRAAYTFSSTARNCATRPVLPDAGSWFRFSGLGRLATLDGLGPGCHILPYVVCSDVGLLRCAAGRIRGWCAVPRCHPSRTLPSYYPATFLPVSCWRVQHHFWSSGDMQRPLRVPRFFLCLPYFLAEPYLLLWRPVAAGGLALLLLRNGCITRFARCSRTACVPRPYTRYRCLQRRAAAAAAR